MRKSAKKAQTFVRSVIKFSFERTCGFARNISLLIKNNGYWIVSLKKSSGAVSILPLINEWTLKNL